MVRLRVRFQWSQGPTAFSTPLQFASHSPHSPPLPHPPIESSCSPPFPVMSGTKPRSGSLGHRMAAFFTPTKNNNSSRRDNSAEEQTEQEQTNLQQQQQQPPPSSSMSSPSPSPSSSSSSSSSSFLGTLRARASAALASRRFESSERQAAKAGGIEKINSKMYHAIQKEEEMGKDKQIQTLEASGNRQARQACVWWRERMASYR